MSRFAFLLNAGTVSDRKSIFGKDVANSGLIRALGQTASPEDPLCLAVTEHTSAEMVAERFRIPLAHLRLIAANRIAEAGIKCLLHGLPNIHHSAWQRSPSHARSYSLCGLIHTLAPPATQDTIARVLTAPLHPWDALICTSSALAQAVTKLLAEWNAYYGERFGGTRQPSIHVPVLPLGIHCDDFTHDPAARMMERHKLGIGENDIAVLWMGRLSFFEKMHPYATFAAMELAARKCKRKLHLVLTGWFPHPDHERDYRAMAAATCPSVTLHIVDGTDSDQARRIWSAADIFTSLVDNVQETFGLAPVEAMAAGLPSVVSDWDGYRDTIVSGETGLRIATLMPPGGSGQEPLDRHLAQVSSYQSYAGTIALATAVDIRGAGDALALLANDDDRRRRMGMAAQARARAVFDWPKVALGYRRLMADLDQRRGQGDATVPTGNPMAQDPFTLFSHYASLTLDDHDRLHALPGAENLLAQADQYHINNFVQATMATPAETRAILKRLHAGPQRIGDLAASAPEGAARCRRTIGWMIKLGLLALERPPK